MATAQRDATPLPDDAGGRTWTCVGCRRRKIKCDKQQPCSQCVRANTECIASSTGRASMRSSKRRDLRQRLAERTSTLEGMVQSFHHAGENSMRVLSSDHSPVGSESELLRQGHDVSIENVPVGQGAVGAVTRSDTGSLPPSAAIPDHSRPPSVEANFEQLFSSSGAHHYVNTCLLDVLQHEIGGPKIALGVDSGRPQPSAVGLGFCSRMHDSPQLSIRHDLLESLWGYFRARVDPIMKVLHVPSTESIITAASNLKPISTEAESLIFSICHIAIRSLTTEECIRVFGEDRDSLSFYHRLGYEQASARAKFIEAANLETMQAHVFYLAALRGEADARALWTMMGVATRAAQSFGLHRDGARWGHLTPFSVEMRRRLWWHLLELEMRISQDNGRAPLVAEMRFDTQMPLNVDDADLSQKMDKLPDSRSGFTEMTVSLIGFELAKTLRRVLLGWQDPGIQNPNQTLCQSTGEEKNGWVTESHQKIEQTYLANLDTGQPFAWVVSTYARLVMSKMWQVVHAPTITPLATQDISSEFAGKLFVASLEAVEEGNRLDNDPMASQWWWFFRQDFQWHSTILLLSELSRHPKGDMVDRAWDAIEALVRGRLQGERNSAQQRVLLWQLVRRLLIKARMTREKKFMEDSRLKGGEESSYGDPPGRLESQPAIDQLLVDESCTKASSFGCR